MAATNGSVFNAMLQEFDGAARILNLEPGIWKSPDRSGPRSILAQRGQQELPAVHRVASNEVCSHGGTLPEHDCRAPCRSSVDLARLCIFLGERILNPTRSPLSWIDSEAPRHER